MICHQPDILTVRGELAKRLNIRRKSELKKPNSYNASLGIGRLQKNRDKPFNGWGIDGFRYVDGVSNG